MTIPGSLSNFVLYTVNLPSVNVTQDNLGGPLLAGTSRSLVCSVPSGLSVTLNWMRNGSPVNTSDSRVTVNTTSSTSTLMFSPLRTSDGGHYQCVLAVTGAVTNSSNMIELNVTSEY